MADKPTDFDKADFEALSSFRFQLASFIRFSERAAKQSGMTPLQYLMLLHVRGFPGRDWATVGELAARLLASAHGTAALVSRCERQGYVERRRNLQDGRVVEVHPTRKGRAVLARVAALHREELRALAAVFPKAALPGAKP
jgi:DNA-binding MarR family transcriptional regulator